MDGSDGGWLAAADILVIPTSGKEPIGARYTSPMKLFEYMAARLPIIAAKVPSLTEILSDDSAFWFEPDNASA